MVKIRNRIAILLTLLCSLCMAVPVWAADTEHVQDDAALFSEAELQEVEAALRELEQETGWEAYAFTTEDTGGYSSRLYGEYAFDDCTDARDGVAFVVDMEHREIALVDFEEATEYLSDARIDDILDDAYTNATDGDYAESVLAMIDGVEHYYKAGRVGENKLTLSDILIALAAALAVGGIFYGVTVGKYRLHFGTYKYDYHSNSSMSLGVRSDNYLRQTVTHQHIQRQQSSGGSGGGSNRTTTHKGAGGRTTGGGSRKF